MGKNNPAEKKKNKKNADAKPWYVRFALPLLILLVVIVYGKSIGFNYTYLDDTTFIFDKEQSNEKLSSLIKIFNEGTFDTKDIYYRPLFRATFIIERQFLPSADEAFVRAAIRVAHFDNLLLHIGCVCLLFFFLQKLSFTKESALVWSALLAVHPASTMAVCWVPGRNDLLLCIFVLAYFINLIDYFESKKTKHFTWLSIFLLLALLTKETAVLIPLVSVLYLLIFRRKDMTAKIWSMFATVWATEWVAWFFLRSRVLDNTRGGQSISDLVVTGISRAPGFLQYIGKVYLPFNLSVVPFMEETTFVYGIVATVLVITLIVLNKQRNNQMVLFGAGWFLLTLLPFFLAPKDIHGGLFEHRLYIPMIGLILVTREAIAPALNFFSQKVGSPAIIFIVVIAAFGIITFTYSDNFANEIVFYKDGIEHSPGSAYLNRMMGVRLLNRGNESEAIPYFRKAYQLDPKEPFVRYFEAKYVYLQEDSLAKAKELLEGEAKDNPSFPDTYFELAHIAFEQHDKASERKYLEKQLELQPKDEVVNNNLLKLYIDLGDKTKAQKQIEHMQSVGLTVDNALTSEVNAMH